MSIKPIVSIVLILFAITACTNLYKNDNCKRSMILLPQPQQIEYKSGCFNSNINSKSIVLKISPEEIKKHQGYRLEISPDKINITAHDKQGAFYAKMTLQQIVRQSPNRKLPCLIINDWPDFENRGVMLDISRDKVPKMETLYKLIDKLAELKINQFQLYTEHTFAYKNHKTVWKDASPMTPKQIRELDSFCKKRFIELVPNQNSFGHFERWLKHPEYKKLAEIPEAPSCLNPENPDSIKLIAELYKELLPNFSSKQFNVGCDETSQLGKGGSSNEVARLGKGRVYLNFLKKINEQVQNNGRTMQFWCDIVLKYPELVPELPTNIIGLIWGYNADEPYKERTKVFADAKIPFYVCPGCGTWNSIIGRTDMMMGNVSNAANAGLQNGAKGLLMTEWGDHGHWQTLPFAYPGFAYAAALSWNFEGNKNINLPLALDTHVFLDENNTVGEVIAGLGKIYKISLTKDCWFHPIATIYLYYYWQDADWSKEYMQPSFVTKLKKSIDKIDELIAKLDNSKMNCDDNKLIIDEIKIDAALAKHAYKLGIARIETHSTKIVDIPKERRRILAEELEKIIPAYEKIWLKRNRIGGLADSTTDFNNLLKIYKKK